MIGPQPRRIGHVRLRGRAPGEVRSATNRAKQHEAERRHAAHARVLLGTPENPVDLDQAPTCPRDHPRGCSPTGCCTWLGLSPNGHATVAEFTSTFAGAVPRISRSVIFFRKVCGVDAQQIGTFGLVAARRLQRDLDQRRLHLAQDAGCKAPAGAARRHAGRSFRRRRCLATEEDSLSARAARPYSGSDGRAGCPAPVPPSGLLISSDWPVAVSRLWCFPAAAR